jgi:hypothetical protein
MVRTLAPFFAALFFPPGNDTAALLSAFATYGAGFLVRPFGALIFGRIGDLVGRKYTFLVTILVMGGATFAVGLLPTFASIGWMAPILLVTLRLLQGLALGGEYGGAATYVAEHARPDDRGYATSFIQTTATLGFFLALLVIGLARFYIEAKTFADWGWRIPFLVSLVLLVFSIYIRLKLNESPVFKRMKAEGKGSKAPLTESFLRYPQQQVRGARAARTPFFIFFGWLSDRIGRLKIIHGAVLRAVLPHHHTQTRLCDGLCIDRLVARHRQHTGRLPDCGRHLLPALRRFVPHHALAGGGCRSTGRHRP